MDMNKLGKNGGRRRLTTTHIHNGKKILKFNDQNPPKLQCLFAIAIPISFLLLAFAHCLLFFLSFNGEWCRLQYARSKYAQRANEAHNCDANAMFPFLSIFFLCKFEAITEKCDCDAIFKVNSMFKSKQIWKSMHVKVVFADINSISFHSNCSLYYY